MTDKPARGGPGRGQGRKPLVAGQDTVRINLTMTAEQRDKLKTLGGSAWIRRMIDAPPAGPELLSALRGLLDALPSATTHPAIKAAKAAIRKACPDE